MRKFRCKVHGVFVAEPDQMAPHEKKCMSWVTPTSYCGEFALAVDASLIERSIYEYAESLFSRLRCREQR